VSEPLEGDDMAALTKVVVDYLRDKREIDAELNKAKWEFIGVVTRVLDNAEGKDRSDEQE
jgi:hypothetical protein